MAMGLSGFAVALGLAYGAGLNLYATITVVGLAARLGIVDSLPSTLAWVGNPWVIGVAAVLLAAEFVAMLTPGVSSAWDTFHSLIRPPAAAILAAIVVWREDPAVVLAAALLGGLLAVVMHTAKLGLRYTIDSSNSLRMHLAASVAELVVVSSVALLVWRYPFATLGAAIGVLIGFALVARIIVSSLRQVFSGHWMPGCGLLQEPRTLASTRDDDDEDQR